MFAHNAVEAQAEVLDGSFSKLGPRGKRKDLIARSRRKSTKGAKEVSCEYRYCAPGCEQSLGLEERFEWVISFRVLRGCNF